MNIKRVENTWSVEGKKLKKEASTHCYSVLQNERKWRLPKVEA